MTFDYGKFYGICIDSAIRSGKWTIPDDIPTGRKTVKCTCGAVKASEPYPPAGHADYCDVNNPPPDTEELPF